MTPHRAHPPYPRRRTLGQGLAALASLPLGALRPTAASAAMTDTQIQTLRTLHETLRWSDPVTAPAGWMEWLMDTPAAWHELAPNPFDTAQIDLWAEFTGPDGQRIRRPAFWRRDRKAHGWCLRWLPPRAGRWTLSTEVKLHSGPALPVGQPVTFEVTAVPVRQVVRADREAPTHFAWNDGTPYTPVGLNVAWGNGGTDGAVADYKRWFKRLAGNGGNFARVWMASWCFSIEWKDTGLGDYRPRLDRAAALDEVFALAEQHGIGLMLCLLNHGAFNDKTDAEWKDNPYNAANGGPCKTPEEFVTDARARALFARRLRYVAARWAASPALFCWEWWNEINWTPIRDEPLMPWIREMDAVLDATDPHRRLRSTSGHEPWSKVWQLPAMDFAQQHDYTSRDLSLHYRLKYREHREVLPSKPLLPGELGMETTYDPRVKLPYNWDVLHLHNGQWAAVFNGYAGTAMYWWWDLMIDPQKLWGSYLGMSRFLAEVNARPAHRLALHRPHPARVSGGGDDDDEPVALALAGPASVLVWVRDAALDPTAQRQKYLEAGSPPSWTPKWQRQQGVRVGLDKLALPDATVQVRWLDAHSGQWLADAAGTAALRGGALELAVPAFERDVAAFVTLQR